MIRLLYISQSAPSVSDEDLRDILQASQRNNASLGITGVLVVGGRMFAQVLEGPEEGVLRKYVRILDDPRHGDCRILLIAPTQTRMFKDWAMGVVRSDPLDFQRIAELRAYRGLAPEPREFTQVLQRIVAQLGGTQPLPR
jgi:hypothetical protein